MAYPTLPEGDNGIAAGYTNDSGISGHGSVIFHDTFESYSSHSDMQSGAYANVYQGDLISFPADPAVSGVGSKCLRIEHEHPRYNNADLSITGVDVVHVRVNMKLSSGFTWLVNGSNQASSAHAGIGISASYDGAGVYPSGTNHYLALFEPTQYRDEGLPGYLHTYCYHMNQGSAFGDHLYSDGEVVPSGSGWSPSGDFVSISPQQMSQGTWHTVEMRCEANTPGSSNGRVTVWLDGAIISDVGDIEFRSTTGLKWDLVQLGVGQGGGLSGSLSGQYVYFDNLVVATEYIGPVYTGTPTKTSSGAATSGAATATGSAKRSLTLSGAATVASATATGEVPGLDIWLIASGSWEDANSWKDNASWIDEPETGAAADGAATVGAATAAGVAARAEWLHPDEVIASTNLQDGDEVSPPENLGDLASAGNGRWWTAINPGADTVAHVGMENPSGGLSGTQSVRFTLRRTRGAPTVTISLYEGSTLVRALVTDYAVTSDTGEEVTAEFDWDEVTNPAAVRFRIAGTAA